MKKMDNNSKSLDLQIKNGLIYLLPVITSSVLPLITLPVFTRILTKEDYGVLALAQVYSTFLYGISQLGMIVAYERNYFQYCNNSDLTAKLLYSILTFVTINFIILATVTLLLMKPLANFIIGSEDHGLILFWSFCATFFNNISGYYLTYFKNSESAKNYSKYLIFGGFINFTISLILVAQMRIGVIGIVYSQLISGITIFSLLTARFLQRYSYSFDWAIFKEAFTISFPLTPRSIFGIFGSQFDKYIISLLANVGGVGVYSIAQKVSFMIFSYMNAIENVFSPKLYSMMFNGGYRGKQIIGNFLTPFAYISIIPAFLAVLFSEEVMYILTPSSYHGAIDIINILAMYYAILFFGKIFSRQLIFVKKTYLTTLLVAFRMSLYCAITIPSILWFGVIGAAWSIFLTEIISACLFHKYSQRYYKINWEYGKQSAMFMFLIAISMTVMLMRFAEIPYLYRLIVKIGSGMSFFIMGIYLNIITLENFTVIRQLFNVKGGIGEKYTEKKFTLGADDPSSFQ